MPFDPIGLKALPAEVQPIFEQLMNRIDTLEAQGAKDVNAIADKIIAAVGPKVDAAVEAVNTLTLTANASVVEVTALARRIDGASATFKLGPEVGQTIS